MYFCLLLHIYLAAYDCFCAPGSLMSSEMFCLSAKYTKHVYICWERETSKQLLSSQTSPQMTTHRVFLPERSLSSALSVGRGFPEYSICPNTSGFTQERGLLSACCAKRLSAGKETWRTIRSFIRTRKPFTAPSVLKTSPCCPPWEDICVHIIKVQYVAMRWIRH